MKFTNMAHKICVKALVSQQVVIEADNYDTISDIKTKVSQ